MKQRKGNNSLPDYKEVKMNTKLTQAFQNRRKELD